MDDVSELFQQQQCERSLSGTYSNNYHIISEYVMNYVPTSVKPPIDPEITDTSYPPESTVKVVKQYQKTLEDEETQTIVKEYKQGKSTYELANEFRCHHSTISAVLKRNGVTVTKRKVDIHVAIQLYESGKSTTEIVKFFNTTGAVVGKALRANGVKMRKSWEYKKA
ncbi:helix-turn-helix domain-containing protein [Candidatus Saccharibacteria bacterium]|nr:helix-turn-helix domain-containing protein [Candidatus Saccharibacteria bacterium]